MILAIETRTLVMRLVAALLPLTGRTIRPAYSDDPNVDMRLIAASTYREGDEARAAALAALAANAAQ